MEKSNKPSGTTNNVDEVTTADNAVGVDADYLETGKLNDDVHNDLGHDMYLASLQIDPAERDAIAKRVKRKLDFIVLPIVSSLYKVCPK